MSVLTWPQKKWEGILQWVSQWMVWTWSNPSIHGLLCCTHTTLHYPTVTWLSLSLSLGILPVFSKENEGWQEAGLLPNPNNQTDTHLTLSLALSLSSQILERERGYTLLNNQLNNIGYFFLTFFSLPLNWIEFPQRLCFWYYLWPIVLSQNLHVRPRAAPSIYFFYSLNATSWKLRIFSIKKKK